MKKIWINTNLEYDNQGSLIKQEGYWYEGEIEQAGGSPTKEHTDWQFYEDGTESGSTPINPPNIKNTNPSKGDLVNDTIYLYRAGIEETAGNAWMNAIVQLEYNKNGAGWNNVNSSSSNIQTVATSNITDGDDTTQRMTSFAYDSTNEGFDEVDGIAGGNTADLASNGFEALWAIQIIGLDVSDGDTIILRVQGLNTYNQTDPTITVEVAAANYSIVGNVGIRLSVAASLAHQDHEAIVGSVDTRVSVNATLKYTFRAAITGDVGIRLNIGATTDYTLNAAIVGSGSMRVTTAATMVYTSIGGANYSITGNVGIRVAIAAALVQQDHEAIVGAVPIRLTIAATTLHLDKDVIIGDVPIKLAIAATMDYTQSLSIIGANAIRLTVDAATSFIDSDAPVDTLHMTILSPFFLINKGV